MIVVDLVGDVVEVAALQHVSLQVGDGVSAVREERDEVEGGEVVHMDDALGDEEEFAEQTRGVAECGGELVDGFDGALIAETQELLDELDVVDGGGDDRTVSHEGGEVGGKHGAAQDCRTKLSLVLGGDFTLCVRGVAVEHDDVAKLAHKGGLTGGEALVS